MKVNVMMLEPIPERSKKDPGTISRLKDRKIMDAELSWNVREFEEAARLFKEAAELCFDTGEFELAIQLLDKGEAARNHKPFESNLSYEKHVTTLDARLTKAMANNDTKQARNILKQMIAIAEQSRDIELLKACKKATITFNKCVQAGN